MRKSLLLLLLTTSSSFASDFPGFCEDAFVYEDSTSFVRAPAAVGGCVGNIVGAPVGFILGLPFMMPEGGAYIVGGIMNEAFNAVTGAPFYVVEYIPRKIYLHFHNE